jgi:integrase
MSAYKDQDTWRWRRTATNPFTGETKRNNGTPEINTKKAADEAERAWVEDFTMDPKLRPVSRDAVPRVKDVADAFYKHMELNTRSSPTYLLKLEGTIRNHIIPDLGDLKIDEVTDSRLREWKNQLVQKPVGLRGPAQKAAARAAAAGKAPLPVDPSVEVPLIKPRTIKDILRVCHGMFVYAFEDNKVGRIPKFPKPPKADKALPVFLGFEETEQLYAATRDDDERLLLLAVQSGLREGEQMALLWTDIDFEKKLINVRRTYKKNKKGAFPKYILGPTKGKRERTVPMLSDGPLIEALRRGRNLKQLVFSRPDGTHLTPTQLNVILRRAKAKAGITKTFHWHDLRHTFGSQAAARGVSMRTLQQWMGHESITTTEIYSHFMPTADRAEIEKMSGSWG